MSSQPVKAGEPALSFPSPAAESLISVTFKMPSLSGVVAHVSLKSVFDQVTVPVDAWLTDKYFFKSTMLISVPNTYDITASSRLPSVLRIALAPLLV